MSTTTAHRLTKADAETFDTSPAGRLLAHLIDSPRPQEPRAFEVRNGTRRAFVCRSCTRKCGCALRKRWATGGTQLSSWRSPCAWCGVPLSGPTS